ncbi:M20 family peptidase [Rudanella lutea]|uniref:M20 family peptidase n=1 Tax=Rudanella lutea TaxID=451374 RepID=UPI0003794AFB|nr:M20 family peptidase [Rudanella lutea]
MKKIVTILAGGLLGLIALLLVNTFRFSSKQLTDVPPAPALNNFSPDSAAARLAEAIRCRTVSYTDYSLTDTTQFDKFIALIRRQFPRLHSRLTLQTVNQYGLLYTWTGKNPALPPVLLLGHYDVVPVIQGTERLWKRPPFAGLIEGGYVYGRGTVDDKTTVMGLLEAVEYLLGTNYQPDRTVMLAFGQDEETLGQRGAQSIAALLEKQGVRPAMVIDEGGTVKMDGIPGFEKPVALVGIGEKGYVSLELTATGEGGHSSMPPRQTSIGIVAAAVAKLEQNPFPARLDAGIEQLFGYVGPEMGFGNRLVFANVWLFAPVVKQILSGSTAGDATQRTTTAATIMRAGQKDNVLPIDATVTVNFRILPGETAQTVTERVKQVIDDERVSVTVLGKLNNPSSLSDPDAPAFGQLHRSIRAVFPEAVVAPYLMLGATDARFYRSICPNVYRFMPIRMTDETLKLPHGTNERVSVKDYADMVRFYVTLIQNTQGGN